MEKDTPFSDKQKQTDVAVLTSNQTSGQEALPGVEILPNNRVISWPLSQVITVVNMYSPYIIWE